MDIESIVRRKKIEKQQEVINTLEQELQVIQNRAAGDRKRADIVRSIYCPGALN